jgi:endonuclease/exonuclease/phosphatase family metal-dependent hydrolase
MMMGASDQAKRRNSSDWNGKGKKIFFPALLLLLLLFFFAPNETKLFDNFSIMSWTERMTRSMSRKAVSEEEGKYDDHAFVHHQAAAAAAGNKPKVAKKKTASRQAVHLVCFNIHNGFADRSDKKCTFDQTIAWLAKEKADVVCFQEVSWRFKQSISQESVEKAVRDVLGLKHIAYGYAAELYGGFFGQMTCSRFPFAQNSISLDLKPDPYEHEGRNALVTHLARTEEDAVAGRAFFTVINTHLDAWDESEQTRLAQIKQLVAYVKKQRKVMPQVPVTLVGDFNAVRPQDFDVSSEEFEEAANSCLALDYLMKQGGAQDVFDRLGQRATHPRQNGNPWRIDFVWLFSQHDAVVVKQAAFASHVKTSDHNPIVTDLDVRTTQK